MRRIALVVGIIASLAMSQIANATTIHFVDKTLDWPGWTATSNPTADGGSVTPNINSTDVTMNLGTPSGAQLTNVTFNLSSANYTVFSGDLFFDKDNNGTWDYVVRALGTPLNTSAALSIYAINIPIAGTPAQNAANYVFSSDPPLPVSSYRAGIPVGLLTTPTSNPLGTGTVNYLAGASAISFDFTQSSPLFFGQDFALGYTETCGNDVIFEKVPVPEPGTMMLLGFGLLGMAVYGKRRMNKEA